LPYKTYGVRRKNLGIASMNRQIQKYVTNHNEDGPKTKVKMRYFSQHFLQYFTIYIILWSIFHHMFCSYISLYTATPTETSDRTSDRVSKMYAIIIMNVRTSNSSPVLPATSHHEERDPCKYSEDASYSAPYTLPGTLKMRKHLRYRYDVAFGSQQATARQRHRVTWLKINIIKLLPSVLVTF
jgi:hypothetical protein